MSFGRLLAAGKSWVGGEGTGRYRMSKHIRLPKFISPQNPFRPDPDPGTPMFPAVRPVATGPVAAAPMPANQVSWSRRLIGGLGQFIRWFRDHNPFGKFGRAERTAIPRFGGFGAQGELSLDKVKVLRGDLTHADLEVIPAGPGGSPATNPAWKNLVNRMLGAGLK